VLHVLDANVLITANRDYYPIERVPEFWQWLLHMGASDLLKLPVEVVEEVRAGNDAVAQWLSEQEHRKALTLEEEADIITLQRVIADGYAPDLTDVEVEAIGLDPFLITYAMHDQQNRCVVTTEVSKPRRIRHNRHIPDVCNTLGVQCINSFGLVRTLDFSTGWQRHAE
jgi:hypothetical protein